MARLRDFRLKLAFLSVLAVAFALSGLLSVSAQQELTGGWQDIAISEDMVGKSISSSTVKGSCNVVQAWGAYSTKRPASKTEGNWIRLHWEKDSRTITKDVAGFGLRLFTPENTKCSFGTKGYAENLGKSSQLATGWNFVSVSKGMGGKSFEDIQNTCAIEKVRLYLPNVCEAARASQSLEPEETCEGGYAIIMPEGKLTDFYLGKGIWVKVASDCELDEYARPFVDGRKPIIAISEDMVGQKVGDFKGSCDVETAFYYDASKTEVAEAERYSLIYTKSGEPQPPSDVTAAMVGKGLSIFLSGQGAKCQLSAKGYTDRFGEAVKLVKGNNLIGIPKSMVAPAKTFNDVKGDCIIESVQVYDKSQDNEVELTTAFKFGPEHLGKAAWVKVTNENGCALDDSEKPPIVTLGGEGVNLVPELVISPSEGLKGGDAIEVILFVKNIGTKNAHYSEIGGGTAVIYNVVYFYEDAEYGLTVIPPLEATLSFPFLPGGFIKPGDSEKVQVKKQSVRIPEDFSGKLVVTAVVDTQRVYPETNKDDNRQPKTISVRAIQPPNLMPTEAETHPVVEALPAEILSVTVTVKNTGEKAAAAENQFLENKVKVLKGDTEICSGDRRDLVTIQPGKSEKFWISFKPVPGQTKCELSDKNANYWIAVEVDTIELVAADGSKVKGTITESNEEDNKKTFQIKEQPTCLPIGSREAGKYCNIATAVWKDQKDSGKECSHNFECKFEYCVKAKCVTEQQKEQILKIVG